MIAKFKLANLLFAAVTFVSLASCTQVAPDIRRDPAAEQGHASAQNNLGIMSEKGQGAPPDDARVMGWYRAAEQGNAIAKYNLGLMYDTGAGVPQDYAEAARWYRSAAEQGHARAKYILGIMYANGDGVPKDYVLSHMWLNLAGAAGDGKASDLRETVAILMTPAQITEAQRMAREWRPTAN